MPRYLATADAFEQSSIFVRDVRFRDVKVFRKTKSQFPSQADSCREAKPRLFSTFRKNKPVSVDLGYKFK